MLVNLIEAKVAVPPREMIEVESFKLDRPGALGKGGVPKVFGCEVRNRRSTIREPQC